VLAANEAAGMLYRKERRRFRQTGIFLALSVLVGIGGRVHGWLTMRRVAELMTRGPAPDIDEIQRILTVARGVTTCLAVLLLVLLLHFLGYFIAWLVAIRSRREAFEGPPPTR
jgi:hypothetical protein